MYRVMGVVVDVAGLTSGARPQKSKGKEKQEEHTVDVIELREQLRDDYFNVMRSFIQTINSLETAVRSTQDILDSRSLDVTFDQVGEIVDLALRAQKEWSSAQALRAAMRGTWWD